MSRNRGIADEVSLRTLKKRLEHLERDNSRLRKTIRRMEANRVELDDNVIEKPEGSKAAPALTFQCSSCKGTEYDKLELEIRGVKNLYLLCKDCGKSHRVKR